MNNAANLTQASAFAVDARFIAFTAVATSNSRWFAMQADSVKYLTKRPTRCLGGLLT
jgi:hypothetical protein